MTSATLGNRTKSVVQDHPYKPSQECASESQPGASTWTERGGPARTSPHGFVWRTTTEERPAQSTPLPRAEYEQRLERYHRPYHRALAGLLEERRRRAWAAVAVALFPLCWASACAARSAPGSSKPAQKAAEPFEELPVPGHNPAIVSLPASGNPPRPLVVAAHGSHDRAEWYCELWRGIVGARAFVICPRGRRTDRRVPHESARYYYPDHFALEREVLAAVGALRERYPAALDASAAVYTGFSQGAIQGALVIALHPGLFPRAALVEGGNGFFDEWSPWAARRYRKGGGERVLFGCGSPYCVRTAERCAGYLDQAGVTARVIHAEGAGHSYGPEMEEELKKSFAWLVEGDGRFSD